MKPDKPRIYWNGSQWRVSMRRRFRGRYISDAKLWHYAWEFARRLNGAMS